MKIEMILAAGLTVLVGNGFLATSAGAATILIGGEDGTTDPPSPTEGTQTEEDWNPTVTCSIGPGQGILDLLTCLEDSISNPPPACYPSSTVEPSQQQGPVHLAPREDPQPCADYPYGREDFNVLVLLPPPDRWGIEILRLDGSEIDRLTFRENDPGIQTTELQLNASSHVARIHLVEGQPTGTGSILLTVNNTEVSVPTSLYPTAGEINSELQSLLRRAAFDVRKVDQFLQVRATVPVDGIRRVQFRSTDPGIRRSDLSLLPEGDTALVPGVISPPLPTE